MALTVVCQALGLCVIPALAPVPDGVRGTQGPLVNAEWKEGEKKKVREDRRKERRMKGKKKNLKTVQ